MTKPAIESNLARLLQLFFCNYLIDQRSVSPRTIESYRDSFRLLLVFLQQQLQKRPETLALKDIDAPQVLAYLDFLEQGRRNSVRSRNVRLAAIRSFMRYAALLEPTELASIQRVLAIPFKRCDRTVVAYLSKEEIHALLQAPDPSTWSGHRDRVMLATFYNTGARVSEILGLNIEDLRLGSTASLQIRGKGRKERVVPLWKKTKLELREWLARIHRNPDSPLFPNRRGERLTRSGIRTRMGAVTEQAIPGEESRFSPGEKSFRSLRIYRVGTGNDFVSPLPSPQRGERIRGIGVGTKV